MHRDTHRICTWASWHLEIFPLKRNTTTPQTSSMKAPFPFLAFFLRKKRNYVDEAFRFKAKLNQLSQTISPLCPKANLPRSSLFLLFPRKKKKNNGKKKKRKKKKKKKKKSMNIVIVNSNKIYKGRNYFH